MAGVKEAYKSVTKRVKETSQDPLRLGETLILDLLHEKSHELSRFAVKVESP